jgi:predicted nucleotidyltransferase
MSHSIDLSDAQIDALASMRDVLASIRWALIGASAIRCRMPLPRPTADVDFAVAASGEDVFARLRAAGWVRHPKKVQTWLRGLAAIDVVPATDEDLLVGNTCLEDGAILSIVGFDLAFTVTDPIDVRDGLAVPVPRLPVLLLLKMIAWLDRPDERQKDLEDLVFMWDHALDEDDDRRWDPSHPVGAAALDYADQSAFFAGWQLGQIAGPEHLHWAKRFVDVMRDDESAAFAQLVRASRYPGEGAESRLRASLSALELGLQVGASPGPRPVLIPAPSIKVPAPASLFSWGRSGSLEMLFHDAIDRHRVVRFVYHGQPRIAEPHILGTKNGRLHVLTWQTGGTSYSGSLPNWRRFFVDQLSGLELTDVTFPGPRATLGRRDAAFDRQIAVIRPWRA